MDRKRLGRLWRATVAVLLALAARTVFGLICGMNIVRTPVTTEWQLLGGSFLVGFHVARSIAYTLPTVALCLCVFSCFADRAHSQDHEPQCRKCAYILRGLRTPRCPECGEEIQNLSITIKSAFQEVRRGLFIILIAILGTAIEPVLKVASWSVFGEGVLEKQIWQAARACGITSGKAAVLLSDAVCYTGPTLAICFALYCSYCHPGTPKVSGRA